MVGCAVSNCEFVGNSWKLDVTPWNNTKPSAFAKNCRQIWLHQSKLCGSVLWTTRNSRSQDNLKISTQVLDVVCLHGVPLALDWKVCKILGDQSSWVVTINFSRGLLFCSGPSNLETKIGETGSNHSLGSTTAIRIGWITKRFGTPNGWRSSVKGKPFDAVKYIYISRFVGCPRLLPARNSPKATERRGEFYLTVMRDKGEVVYRLANDQRPEGNGERCPKLSTFKKESLTWYLDFARSMMVRSRFSILGVLLVTSASSITLVRKL
jgi:hypothetical protein